MKLCVIVPTYGRKDILKQLLMQLDAQGRLPDEVIISAPDETHLKPAGKHRFPLRYVFGGNGSCSQRNRALDEVQAQFDIVTFFDDDFVPATNYLATVEVAFATNPEWAVVTGNVVADGARSAGITWDEAIRALEMKAVDREESPQVRRRDGAYGCNMSIRCRSIGEIRFDENLPMYGWQEDIDFTNKVAGNGGSIWLSNLLGAHLGTKSGKPSGIRLGYSQVANPLYLWRKGTMRRSFAFRLIGQNIASNVFRSVTPEPYIDRRGRLRGNLLALAHLFGGRLDPRHILRLR